MKKGNVRMQQMDDEFYNVVSRLNHQDPRYHPEAYAFVMEALAFTQKKYKKVKHVTGLELLEGIKALLLNKFGPMTVTVLTHWGVKSTDDFGNIVYNLVAYKILNKDDQDHYESFTNVYDFEEVFIQGYRKQLAKRLKTMRF